MASGGGNLIDRAASVGMDSLAVMLLSVCSKPGVHLLLFLGGDSLIGFVGHFEQDHLWNSIKGNLLIVSCGSCSYSAIGPFGLYCIFLLLLPFLLQLQKLALIYAH